MLNTVKTRLFFLAFVAMAAIVALSLGVFSLLRDNSEPLSVARRGIPLLAPLRDGMLTVSRFALTASAASDGASDLTESRRARVAVLAGTLGELSRDPSLTKETAGAIATAADRLRDATATVPPDRDVVESALSAFVAAFTAVDLDYSLSQGAETGASRLLANSVNELPRLLETTTSLAMLSGPVPSSSIRAAYYRNEGWVAMSLDRLRNGAERAYRGPGGELIRAEIKAPLDALSMSLLTPYRVTPDTVDVIETLWKATDRVAARRVDERVDAARRGLVETGAGVLGTAIIIVLGLVGVLRRLGRRIDGLSAAMTRMAAGDYVAPVPFTGKRDEFGRMADMLAAFRDGLRQRAEMERSDRESATRLRAVAVEVAGAVDMIRSAAGEISIGGDDLAGRTEIQVSQLEETVSAMNGVAAKVETNAAAAARVHSMSVDAKGLADKGAACMTGLIDAMDGIENSATRITDIIEVMEEISFQIKLLALNAAVEAARAGAEGRGFAVVAQEVRSLAERSSEASREIRDIIGESQGQVKRGAKAARTTGDALGEIVGAIQKVSGLMPEIAAASRDQASLIGGIKEALNDIDGQTQKNAALVEQSSAASRLLADQARRVFELMRPYRDGDGASP